MQNQIQSICYGVIKILTLVFWFRVINIKVAKTVDRFFALYKPWNSDLLYYNYIKRPQK